MDVLARWLVQQPLHILYGALVLVLAWALLRGRPWCAHRASALLFAALGWLVYAGGEWWVLVESPEADIRVDLLLIWPLLAALTAWALLRVAIPPKTRAAGTIE